MFRHTCRIQTLCSRSSIPLRFSRGQATVTTALDGAVITPTNRAEVTLKRFWKTVGIESQGDSFTVTLDKRPLKTPLGKLLKIPASKRLLATLIADEWENQETLLKHHALPMTSLVSRAIDGLADEKTRKEVQAALLQYLGTDTICFHEEHPATLVSLQDKHWNPILSWARESFDVDIAISDSLFHSQPLNTVQKFSEVLDMFDTWEMTAMERATYTTKSFLIALALVKQRLTVEEAAEAARVEVISQIQRWGEVEDSHDVDYHDVRRQLGSAACVLINV